MTVNPNPADQVDHPTREAKRFSLQVDKLIFLGILILFGLIAAGSVILAVINSQWQYFIIAASSAVSLVSGILTYFNLLESKTWGRGILFTLVSGLGFIAIAFVLNSQVSIALAVISLVITILLGSFVAKGSFIDWSVPIGLITAILITVAGNITLVQQLQNPTLNLGIFIAAIVFVLLLILLMIFGLIKATLRFKLVLGALLLTMIPLAILAVIENQFTQNAIQTQSNQSLQIAADQTAAALNNFFETNLDSTLNEASLPAIQSYLAQLPEKRAGSREETELKATFDSLQTKQKIYPPSYALLDANGINLYGSDTVEIGQSEAETDYFKAVISTGQAFSSGVEFEPNSHNAYLFFSAPVKDVSNQLIGVLRIRYDALLLQSLIQSNVGLIGSRSYPILLDENGLRLADGFSPNLLYRTLVELDTAKYQALLQEGKLPPYLPRELSFTNQTDLAAALANTQANQFFTVVVRGDTGDHTEAATAVSLSSHPWKLVYLKETTALVAARDAQNRLSTLIATAFAGVVGILIMLVSGLFTRPILQLTETAEKISSGDLTAESPISSNDEIGILGTVFNSMTRQLRNLVDTLESRVQERTEQLARQNEALTVRSRQLQTVADVARSIVSNRDLESLLTDVTTLISERFDFYHVGIFLVDNKGEFAILRAANSTGGRRMLARNHRLKVGQVGIVGYTTGTGQPRIATDVGQDAVYFNNPDLPETRSEMALPLKVENRIIGALDVQSVKSNAFSQEDIELFSTLADQVAIAINNNQLYADTIKALDDAQNLHRQYLNQEWSRTVQQTSQTSYKFSAEGLTPIDENLPEIDTVLASARPILKSERKQAGTPVHESVMAVPILLRGEAIGVIHLQARGEDEHVWSENELATVQAVADQVAQTLENARLFEQTIRRADRERKVLEITSKIRSTNDPQQMLRITLEELRRNLSATDAQIIINMPGNGSPYQNQKE